MTFPFFWVPDTRLGFSFDPVAKTGVEVFRFTARQLVSAIAFHLVDEGIATGVCPRSCDTVTQILVSCGQPDRPLLKIAKTRWRTMTNFDRLRWLLDHTMLRVDVSAHDGVARLFPA